MMDDSTMSPSRAPVVPAQSQGQDKVAYLEAILSALVIAICFGISLLFCFRRVHRRRRQPDYPPIPEIILITSGTFTMTASNGVPTVYAIPGDPNDPIIEASVAVVDAADAISDIDSGEESPFPHDIVYGEAIPCLENIRPETQIVYYSPVDQEL